MKRSGAGSGTVACFLWREGRKPRKPMKTSRLAYRTPQVHNLQTSLSWQIAQFVRFTAINYLIVQLSLLKIDTLLSTFYTWYQIAFEVQAKSFHIYTFIICLQFYVNKCPTRCNYTQFILSVNCCTCFGWCLPPSSGSQITVSTASVTSQPLLLPVEHLTQVNRCCYLSSNWHQSTVIATCRASDTSQPLLLPVEHLALVNRYCYLSSIWHQSTAVATCRASGTSQQLLLPVEHLALVNRYCYLSNIWHYPTVVATCRYRQVATAVDQCQMLQIQLFVVLMMGEDTTRNMYSSLQIK